jgi:plastocyanin
MSGSGWGNVLWVLSLLLLAPCAAATTRTVTIENLQFSPAVLSVHRGDRIVWVNKDLFPHTVTADKRAFDSGSIAAGASWTYVVRKSGKFSYACTFHPVMKGSVEVK